MVNFRGDRGFNLVWDEGYEEVYTFGGNDIIFEVQGSSFVNGGTGTDWLSFYYSPKGVKVGYQHPNWLNSVSGYDDHEGFARYLSGNWANNGLDIRFESIEKISGSTFGDMIWGSRRAETIYGWSGDDRIEGYEGQDRLFGGAGNDSMMLSGGDEVWGGADRDIFSINMDDAKDITESPLDEIDVIMDFSLADDDFILIYGDSAFDGTEDFVRRNDFEFAGNTSTLGDKQYSVWQRDDEYIVSWRFDGEYHDLRVRGDDPTSEIFFTTDIV